LNYTFKDAEFYGLSEYVITLHQLVVPVEIILEKEAKNAILKKSMLRVSLLCLKYFSINDYNSSCLYE